VGQLIVPNALQKGISYHKKSRALPIRGLEGCEMLRIPRCLDNRLTDGGNVVSPNTPAALYSAETLIFHYSIVLEAE
jgi:hypothetical protein